jgi:signal transduction histidine kinase
MSPARFLENMRLRNKLFIGFLSVFVTAIVLQTSVIYWFVRNTIEARIESELKNTTESILNMVNTAATVSIKNHLRAVAEKNRDIVAHFYNRFKNGEFTEQEAKAGAAKVLLSQPIGSTGYLFVWDVSKAPNIIPLAVHPVIQGEDVAYVDFVQEGARLKTGYIEYRWKNPDEPAERDKAMYLTYFKPWEWVIAASSYRNEFSELVNMDDFSTSILSQKFGKTGYCFVIQSNGDLLLHPKMPLGNYYLQEDAHGKLFLKELCDRKNGKLIYWWQNPDESHTRKKLVYFNHIPELDWIVASTCYFEEFYSPLKTVGIIFVATILLTFLLFLPIAFWINASIMRVVRQMQEKFEIGASGDFSVRMPVKYRDEITRLGEYFNTFMLQLQQYSARLEGEIKERKTAEHEKGRLLKELDTRKKELESIVYVTSHDLRSPLVNIQGFSRELAYLCERLDLFLLEADIPAEKYRKILPLLKEEIPDAVRFITTSAGKMDLLLQGLLKLSRLGHMVLHIKKLDMNKLVGNIVQSFEYRIRANDIKITMGDLPPCLGDEIQVSQVFTNLVDNALNYLHPERAGRVRITGSQDGDRVVYCVEDNGIGIAPRNHGKVFEIFHRLNPEKAMSGEGLGLNIIRQILDLHGGGIRIDSQENKGSRFYVTLPSLEAKNIISNKHVKIKP